MSGVIVADDWIARLDAEARREVEVSMTPRTFARGAVVSPAGTPADMILRVRAGYVKQTGIGEDGALTLLTIYAPGACFAETAVVAGGVLNHTAIALTDAVVERLGAADFWALYRAHPAIADALCRKFAAAIRRQVADREERAALKARVRIARLFAGLVQDASLREPDGRYRIDLPLTHGDLAGHLHLTRQSVQRELAAFKQAGAVLRLPSGWLVDGDRLRHFD